MGNLYGYVRISTKKQSIDRQVRNILAKYPEAKIYAEVYTGTKLDGRTEFVKLLKLVERGDRIVFDSVSRMARNAEEGVGIYFELYEKGVELEFLKEPYVNTDTYKAASSNSVDMTGNEIADIYIEATNQVIKILAKEQIKQAFEQSEKEVLDLSQRTKEGIITARLNGAVVGRPPGKYETTKAKQAKAEILKYSKVFGGTLPDAACIKLCGISRPSFYKYKRELLQERNENIEDSI